MRSFFYDLALTIVTVSFTAFLAVAEFNVLGKRINKMKIRHLKIRNFRGIEELEWALPDSNLFCFIGRGDSTKSTILEAIRYAFHPQWYLSFDDSDFYLCRTKEPISIEVTIGDLPDEFISLTKYGRHLRGWNKDTLLLSDEPGNGLEDVLTIILKVDDSLEPKWRIFNERESDGVEFNLKDRSKAGASYIGAYTDLHLTWGKGSVLSKLTEFENINFSLAGAARAAKDALDCQRNTDFVVFDDAASKVEITAKKLGVTVLDKYKAHLDVGSVNVKRGGLALHDGDIPLRQLGLGSRRMLICGLQKQALNHPHITLFDEIEIGLEPYRISRLLQHIKEDTSGQYFLTTHSPVVLRELTISDLYVVHSKNGKTEVISTNQTGISDAIQGNIRSGAEAFLSTKVIVCEGATEVGLCRGLDNYWLTQEKATFAYQGVACLDANGAHNIKILAENMKALGYNVAILVDSDSPDNFSPEDGNKLKECGVEVVCWDGIVSIEERIFADIPWEHVIKSIECASTIHGDKVVDQIGSEFGAGFNRKREEWSDTCDLRTAIGKAAGKCGWFKRQDRAEEWFEVIRDTLNLPKLAETDWVIKVNQLRDWIDRE